jgi:hypothetical protein
LIEVDPTDYIIYGSTDGGDLETCNCLGTVGFHADAGVITDLGTILFDDSDAVSEIPELAPITGVTESAVMSSLPQRYVLLERTQWFRARDRSGAEKMLRTMQLAHLLSRAPQYLPIGTDCWGDALRQRPCH